MKDLPEGCIRRLPLYLRQAQRYSDSGVDTVSSKELSEDIGVSPETIRKDLSQFGEFGTRGVGYNPEKLVKEIKSILNLHSTWDLALVGVGNIGSALLTNPEFEEGGFCITLAFDRDPEVVGKNIGGLEVLDVEEMTSRISEEGIDMGVIAVPPGNAQSIADSFVEGGVTGILNFAPVKVDVPSGIELIQVDITCELSRLAYYTGEKLRTKEIEDNYLGEE